MKAKSRSPGGGHKPRRPSMAASQRQAMARQLGRAMKKAGVRVGRKNIPLSQIPNVEVYRGIMAGMGRSVKRVDMRKIHKR